ncbi:HTH-type transcriptional regulator YjdC [Variibacter gotjawalensis]|uniref:HTH-type transcriptional regulator YjdC n=1 Tax=Variibacter gotjawalensis TaxID=1333996 RepID=A0A0S3PP17_9BRAD|nr:TetR/AcrR family transcriptional regulator [Variibacter gotjawalensis]NIK48009.1 AcrR family transcriptional regulator [Variibacter gotjawalensis]RZS49886.1 TetR family transcriptional regulator [Variibacter gotjawalensis]BAT57714.1 HTH-type transcriptional regulator YjdC [Variibacter gotjawalensis]
MSTAAKIVIDPVTPDTGDKPKVAPRERILAAASDLFYRQGIKSVGVDAIAEAADTNKMTLYRHFGSKDDLVAACLHQFADEVAQWWQEIVDAHPGQPREQIKAWLSECGECVTDPEDRGCALINAAIEISDKDHPARKVVEDFKRREHDRLTTLCADAGATEPAQLADELFLLMEGARVCSQSMGPEGPSQRMCRMGEVLLDARLPKP